MRVRLLRGFGVPGARGCGGGARRPQARAGAVVGSAGRQSNKRYHKSGVDVRAEPDLSDRFGGAALALRAALRRPS